MRLLPVLSLILDATPAMGASKVPSGPIRDCAYTFMQGCMDRNGGSADF